MPGQTAEHWNASLTACVFAPVTQLLDSLPARLPGIHFLPTYTNSTWPVLVSYVPFSLWCPGHVIYYLLNIRSKLNLFPSTCISNPGFLYKVLVQCISLHSFFYLFCLPKSHLSSEQNHKTPPFHIFKTFQIGPHLTPLSAVMTSLLFSCCPPSQPVLFGPSFLMSHARDRSGFTEVNCMLLSYFSACFLFYCLTPPVHRKHALEMSCHYLVIPKKRRHTMYAMGMPRYVYRLKKSCLIQIFSYAATLKRVCSSGWKKLCSNSYRYSWKKPCHSTGWEQSRPKVVHVENNTSINK